MVGRPHGLQQVPHVIYEVVYLTILAFWFVDFVLFAFGLGGFSHPLELVLAMGIHGMEIIAIVVVTMLFYMVLKQFGLWEPLSLEGE